MAAGRLPAELCALLERAVEHPLGFQLLYKGHLESVAALFGVHPSLIESTREWVRDPRRRDAFTAALVAAREQRRLHPEIDHLHPEGSGELSPPKNADELLHDIDALPDGEEFLFHATPETVGVLFSVHPFVVLEARQRLADRGYTPRPDDTEDGLA